MEITDRVWSSVFWVGFFGLDCFVESFVCVWMGMAGYTDDQTLFPVMWVFHLLVAYREELVRPLEIAVLRIFNNAQLVVETFDSH